jgi:hypothetical protein
MLASFSVRTDLRDKVFSADTIDELKQQLAEVEHAIRVCTAVVHLMCDVGNCIFFIDWSASSTSRKRKI